jgi:hypothetical protein
VRHLGPDDFVDLADGVDRPDARLHLDRCASCQEELVAFQAMTGNLDLTGDVPEPSPLFGTHFPQRVGRALEQAVQQEPRWWARTRLPWVWFGVPPAVATALVIGVAVGAGWSSMSQRGSGERTGITIPPDATALADEAGTEASVQLVYHNVEDVAEDPSWTMLLLMADTASWEGQDGRELFVSDGAAERAVFELSLTEREELKRLLESEMGDGPVGKS